MRLYGCVLLAAMLVPGVAVAQRAGISVQGQELRLDGQPFKILSGELHYARIPRAYWRDRLKMAKAMGLNTVATYVFWNVHEPRPGEFRFTGQYDLAAFVKMAQEEGLYVLLRSGPYACAEWDLGGLPPWLLATPESAEALRSNDPAFMVPVERWVHALAKVVLPLQYANGGPILMTQIENEYGNYGSDKAYMGHLRDIYVREGFTPSSLLTADNWRNIPKGDLPGLLAATNFGIGNHEGGMNALERERPGQPLFVSEYWPGWFDHWGHPHETRETKPQIEDLDYILKRGVGVNVYMFHGGTSFGYYAGATGGAHFLPNVTSYDYDAPLDESGRPTAKFAAYREELAKFHPKPLPPVPTTGAVMTTGEIALADWTPLWEHLPEPVTSDGVFPMEHFGQGFGYILYRTTLGAEFTGELHVDEVHDFARVFVDGRLVGTLDRRNDEHRTVKLEGVKAGSRLDILVSNDGRINSTRAMRMETKGITKSVTLGDKEVTGWMVYRLPLGEDGVALPTSFQAKAKRDEPGFYRGVFTVTTPGDTFLDVKELGKGAVWVNGHALGRYWNAGPQQTLYLPGPWLKKGRNEVVVFEMLDEVKGPVAVRGLAKPVLDAATKEHTTSAQQ